MKASRSQQEGYKDRGRGMEGILYGWNIAFIVLPVLSAVIVFRLRALVKVLHKAKLVFYYTLIKTSTEKNSKCSALFKKQKLFEIVVYLYEGDGIEEGGHVKVPVPDVAGPRLDHLHQLFLGTHRQLAQCRSWIGKIWVRFHVDNASNNSRTTVKIKNCHEKICSTKTFLKIVPMARQKSRKNYFVSLFLFLYNV